MHYRHPQKVNQRVAHYILTLADYNIHIQHHPGPQNRANALSRQPDYNEGKEDNLEVTPLPPYLFGEKAQLATLDALVEESQEEDKEEFKKLQSTHEWGNESGLWKKDNQIAILSDYAKGQILKEHHNHPTMGHPEVAITYFSI